MSEFVAELLKVSELISTKGSQLIHMYCKEPTDSAKRFFRK